MNNRKLTTIAAAIALLFSVGSVAAADAVKVEPKAAEAKSVPEKAVVPAAKKESTGEYVDDSVITGKVKAAIFEDASLKSMEINVETYKGIVQLTGFVKSGADIKNAVKIAHGVKGVKSVKNDMIVKGQQ
jgi:osmotically-inducible protein OsmY